MTAVITKLIRKDEGIPHEAAAAPLTFHQVDYAYDSATGGRPAADSTLHSLKNISFQLNLGERIALVGPNGAGKSTLLKLVVGILKPTDGTVTVFGRPPEKHTCIAYVPQRSQIDWSFPVTVEDVVMMGRVGQIGLFRWPGRKDRDIVQQSLAKVGATHLSKKQIGELSGGQQQRVFIARALAQEAELLLLDEPLSGLDTPSQTAVFDILDNLKAADVTAVIATHQIELATDRFDRMMLLNKKIVSLDTPENCLTAENLVQAYGGGGLVRNEQLAMSNE